MLRVAPPRPAPLAVLHAIAADPAVQERSFASDTLRPTMLRLLMSMADAGAAQDPSAQEMASALREIVRTKCPDLQRLRGAVLPLEVRGEMVAAIAHASWLLSSGWQAAPVERWVRPADLPPARPIRAACKVAERCGALPSTWPVISSLALRVLRSVVDAVRASAKAQQLLREVFDRERKASLETYQRMLRRLRRDTTYKEYSQASQRLTGRCGAVRAHRSTWAD